MTRRPAFLAAASSLMLTLSGFAVTTTPQQQTTQPGDGTSVADLLVTVRLEEIRAERDAYEAGRLVERAVREELAGRDDAAQELYARALELDPDHPQAKAGLDAARDRLGLATEPLTLIERTRREATARRQEVLYRFNAAIRAAGDGIAKGTPEGFRQARLELDRARLARESHAAVFSAEDHDLLDARLGERDVALKAAVQARADAIERARRKEAARRIKEARVHDIRRGL